jgi:hypothetical protein
VLARVISDEFKEAIRQRRFASCRRLPTISQIALVPLSRGKGRKAGDRLRKGGEPSTAGGGGTFVKSLHGDAVPVYTQDGYQQHSAEKRGSEIEMVPNGYAESNRTVPPPLTFGEQF